MAKHLQETELCWRLWKERLACHGGHSGESSTRTTSGQYYHLRRTSFGLQNFWLHSNRSGGETGVKICKRRWVFFFSAQWAHAINCVGARKSEYICKGIFSLYIYTLSHFLATSTAWFVCLLHLFVWCVSYVHCVSCPVVHWTWPMIML